MTDLSIVTVSYKGWDRLRKSLDSLSAFSGTAFRTEIIIVDNNSGDGVLAELEKEYPSVRFIRNSVNGGFSNGCNLGASFATGEYVLFLNPDTVAGEKALGQMLAVMRARPEISILSCRQVNERGKECSVSGSFPSFRNLTGFLRILDTMLSQSAREAADSRPQSNDSPVLSVPDWVSGSVIMMNRQRFLSMGGFDEDFWMYYEDVDICRRVSLAGGLVALLHDATIEHNHGGSSRINPKTASLTKTEVHISRHVYISKHSSGLNRLAIQAFLVTNNIISNLVTAAAGLVLFFIPRMRQRVLIFLRLSRYYKSAMAEKSWISPRSASQKC
ncbi:MAG: glycosyltransferase family 2 protein [Bacteroidales bacterium]|jgi:hypothetical protein|nr:glycosyltransferase family 2 protein [Bacteroidales bacterium]